MELASVSLLFLAVGLIALVVGLWFWRGRASSPTPVPAVTASARPATLEDQLRALQAAGRWPELLRLLDQSLPEWPVSSSLIEVARAVSAMERDLAAVRGTAVSGVVTERLGAQAQTVADGLWSLAERLVVAGRLSLPPPQEQLQREDAVLLRLMPAIREAQSGLVELTLASSSAGDLRRAERRFLSLAATARELQDLGPIPPART